MTWHLVLARCVIQFVIAFAGSITTAMLVQGAVVTPAPAIWIYATMLGLGAAAHHANEVLREPPRPTGDTPGLTR